MSTRRPSASKRWNNYGVTAPRKPSRKDRAKAQEARRHVEDDHASLVEARQARLAAQPEYDSATRRAIKLAERARAIADLEARRTSG